MKAWKCDRCGKLYSTFAERGKDDAYRLKNVTVVTLGWSNPDVRQMNSADLCKECAKEFIEWFREPALADITREGDEDEPDQTVRVL